MCLHDVIVGELINKKSLAALVYLIHHGRELEFAIDEKNISFPAINLKSMFRYGITRRNKVFIALMN